MLSFLNNRTTRMRFNGIIINHISILIDIPQGSPLSSILYILYNSDLLEIPRKDKQLGLGFIDDILYGVQSKTAAANASELELLLIKAEKWRQRHGAQFEQSKYVLIHFTRITSAQMEASVKIAGATIYPSSEAKYLGVIFDRKLKFHSHVKQIMAKRTKYALAIAGIAKSKWGSEFKYLRCLFMAVAAPRMDYAAIIWHRSDDTWTASITAQLRALSSVQDRIMRAITGCFRITAIAAMEHETALLPPQWRLTNKILQILTRMMTAASNHPIHNLDKTSTQKWRILIHVKSGKSNQALSWAYITGHGTYRYIYSTSMMEDISHHRNIIRQQGRSSKGPSRMTTPDLNTGSNHIYRWIRSWWIRRRGNTLSHNQDQQRQIYWHR